MNIFKMFGVLKAESSLPYGMSSKQYDVLQSHFGAMWLHQDDPWFNLGDKHSSDNAHEAFRDFTRKVGPWYARGLFGRVSTIPDEHTDIMNLPEQFYFYTAPNEWHSEEEFNAGVVGENHSAFKDTPDGFYGPDRGRGHGVGQSDTHIYGSIPEMEPYPRNYDSSSKYNPAPPLGEESTDSRTELPFRSMRHLARNLGELAAYAKHGHDPANWPDDILETHTPNRTPDEVKNVERWPGEHTASPPPDAFDTDWWDSQMGGENNLNLMLWKMFGIHKEESYKPPPSYTLTLNNSMNSITGGEKSGHEHLGQVARRATRHLNENPNGNAIIDTSEKGKFMVRGGHGKTLTHLHHPQDSTTRKAETYHDLWKTQAEKDGKDFNFSKGNTYLTHDSMRDKFGDVNNWAIKNYGFDHPLFTSIVGEANRAGDTNSLRRMEHMQKGANFLKEKEHPDYWHINTQGLYDLHPDDHIKHMGSAYSDPREGLNLMLWKAFGIHKEESDDAITLSLGDGKSRPVEVTKNTTRSAMNTAMRHMKANPNGHAGIDTPDGGKYQIRGHSEIDGAFVLSHQTHPRASTAKLTNTYHDLWQAQAAKDGKDFNIEGIKGYTEIDPIQSRHADVSHWVNRNYEGARFNYAPDDDHMDKDFLQQATRAGDTSSLNRMEYMQKYANFLREKDAPGRLHINTEGLYDLHPDDHMKHMGFVPENPKNMMYPH